MEGFRSRHTVVLARDEGRLVARLYRHAPILRWVFRVFSVVALLGAAAGVAVWAMTSETVAVAQLVACVAGAPALVAAVVSFGSVEVRVAGGVLTRRVVPFGPGADERVSELRRVHVVARRTFDPEHRIYQVRSTLAVRRDDGTDLVVQTFDRPDEASHALNLLDGVLREAGMRSELPPGHVDEPRGLLRRERPSLGRFVSLLAVAVLLVGAPATAITRVAVPLWGEAILCDEGLSLRLELTEISFGPSGRGHRRAPIACASAERTEPVDGAAMAFALSMGVGAAGLVFAILYFPGAWRRARQGSP